MKRRRCDGESLVIRARAHAETVIDARPTAVYEVLADYTTHHPRIMPSPLFSNLVVEAGGVGAGTIFHITLRTMGREQRLHMQVAEPEPGLALTETDLDSGLVTHFRVAAHDGGTRTLARISSEWVTDGGVRGLVDRFLTPLLLGRIYSKQLRELGRYMHSRDAPV
jgi:Polyketide cyclase / dehydrase and lipid transport